VTRPPAKKPRDGDKPRPGEAEDGPPKAPPRTPPDTDEDDLFDDVPV
jgi:hypothetical protein